MKTTKIIVHHTGYAGMEKAYGKTLNATVRVNTNGHIAYDVLGSELISAGAEKCAFTASMEYIFIEKYDDFEVVEDIEETDESEPESEVENYDFYEFVKMLMGEIIDVEESSDPNKKYIFDLEKYCKVAEESLDRILSEDCWERDCNGQSVKRTVVGLWECTPPEGGQYFISPNWISEVE